MFVQLFMLFQIGCTEPTKDQTDTSESNENQEEGIETVERKVLHEVFSGSNCSPCKAADEILLDVLHNNPGRYVLLGYQVGSDPYVTTEAVRRRMFYLPGESTYSIPWVHADGVNGFHPIEMNNDAGYTQEDFDAFASVPATLEINISHTIVDQTVSANISIRSTVDQTSENLKLHLAVIEETTYQNTGTNGQTEFHHVMKKMIPDENGTAIGPLAEGEVWEQTFSHAFQGDYDETTGISEPVDHSTAHTVEEFSDLSVIAFVQDEQNWEILQSAWSAEE